MKYSFPALVRANRKLFGSIIKVVKLHFAINIRNYCLQKSMDINGLVPGKECFSQNEDGLGDKHDATEYTPISDNEEIDEPLCLSARVHISDTLLTSLCA